MRASIIIEAIVTVIVLIGMCIGTILFLQAMGTAIKRDRQAKEAFISKCSKLTMKYRCYIEWNNR